VGKEEEEDDDVVEDVIFVVPAPTYQGVLQVPEVVL
jgi:hypothetical protein